MYEIKVRSNFAAAHNLRNYRGKCERLHGHNWTVEAVFRYASLAPDGMAIDFREAKLVLAKAIGALDHSYLNELPMFRRMNPTSENTARHIFESIRKLNKNISSVCVWENESSCAIYSKGPGRPGARPGDTAPIDA